MHNLTSPAKTPHKHAAVIKAWADGAEIQVESQAPELLIGRPPTVWTTEQKPKFEIWANYRVKPKTEPVKADPYASLKAAYVSGKTLQTQWQGSTYGWRDWTVPHIPTFSDPVECYRIKPEPKPDCRVPLRVVQEGNSAFLGKFGYPENIVVTFDGETGKLKSVELVK